MSRRLPWRRRNKSAVQGAPPEGVRGPSGKWALSAVVNHVTLAGDRMIAWYLADPQTWSFRSVQEGETLIYDQAARLADLVGTTVYGRVTTRPYPAAHWAAAAWGNAPDPQPGYAEHLERDQLHMASHVQADKLVYYGVDLGGRALAVRALSKVMTGAVDREMQALQERLDAVDLIMAGSGMEARPALGADLEWLLARSFALGCPVPVPAPGEPQRSRLDADDLAEFVHTADWSAEPLGETTQITTSVNGHQVHRHVCVLTISRVGDIAIPETHEPWMAKADRLPFPVEWAWRVTPRPPEEVAKEMTSLSNRIDSQVEHWSEDHGKRPPKQLSRQAARSSDVEDEMRSEFTGLSTRTKGWYRLAVSGQTVEQALERAQRVIDFYKPQIRVVRELGQYHLAREFVPGEPLASTAHARKFPVVKVAAGLPAITAEVGDRRGFRIGETTGMSSRAVCFDPWYLPEVMESSGLVPVVGTPGSGKSMFLGQLTAQAVLSGVGGVGMDPAGRLQRLLELPELAPLCRSVNVLGGRPGSLSPYAVVPEPNRELVRLEAEDEADFEDKLQLARQAARATRRDLALMALRGCLPLQMSRHSEVQRRLRRAIAACPDSSVASATDVIRTLRGGDGEDREIARDLETAAESELGRLFFTAPGQSERDRDRVAGITPARFTMFNLKGLVVPDEAQVPMEDWSQAELLARPILTLAAWSALQVIYRGDPNERKLFVLDEAHEITSGSGPGRALVYKLSSDSRKNNCAALVSTQNASTVLGAEINNFVGACFVGRTQDADAQRDALRLLGKPEGLGYEDLLANLSQRGRRSGERLPYREFVYRDGLGGEGGRGGMEQIRVTLSHHPDLYAALDTTASPEKLVRRLGGGYPREGEGAA